ncbi:hypothetical protein F8S13_04235 [Chloroflexia bacterium SDU3-3]|nr:hypothetical protein F8S13_04235 [Chloroflexia bacterium SDU3-3]
MPAVYAAEPSVTPLDSAPFGINTHLATRYTDLASMDVPAALVANAGAGWAREDVHWWRVEQTQGRWDWSYTDAAFRALLSRGVQVVGVLGHPPGWATPYTGDAPNDVSFYAPDQQLFVAYARAVVQRYGAYIKHWEIWNEPDNELFWKPATDPAAYARLLIDTSAAIHQIDPSAKVLLGGISPFNLSYLRGVAAAGAWGSFDILAIHPYVDPNSPEDGAIMAAADGVRTMMASYGQKPIWATEVGWSSGPGDHDAVGIVDQQQQANYLVRSMLLLWRAGIERSFWYTLKDDPGNPYGLFEYGTGRADFTHPKPAYSAFRTLSQQVSGTSFVSLGNLFVQSSALDFEDFGRWSRGDQPYGSLTATTAVQQEGKQAAAINYIFPTDQNDYVVFNRATPAPISGTPRELAVWAYGDGSGNVLKVWLRDAEGEVLQYSFGTVGPKGWHQLRVSLAAPVAAWNRISQDGNGKLDFPAAITALVLDDGTDEFSGRGTIYLDAIAAVSGPAAYDLRLRRGNALIDVLWAQTPIQASFTVGGANARVVDRDGGQTTMAVRGGSIPSITLGDAPRYVTSTFTSSR